MSDTVVPLLQRSGSSWVSSVCPRDTLRQGLSGTVQPRLQQCNMPSKGQAVRESLGLVLSGHWAERTQNWGFHHDSLRFRAEDWELCVWQEDETELKWKP